MTYVIAEPCLDVMDNACTEVCPVECIGPLEKTGQTRQLYIDPQDRKSVV